MASSERMLMDRIAAGEQEAFGLLFAPYRTMLLQFAAGRLGGEAQLAEDVVQEAALNAFRALAAGARPENLRAWLFTIVRNCASNARRAGRPSIPIEDHHEADVSRDPALVLAGRERIALLMGALGELPDRQRQALLGHALEGHSYREIAVRLDSTVSAVKTLVHRARRSLGAASLPALLPFPRGARRTARLLARGPLAGKAGAKGAVGMAVQALGTAAVTTGILMAVPGAGPGTVIAGGLSHSTPTHRSSHRHHGGHRRSTQGDSHASLERRIHSEARRAIAQCGNGTRKPGHYTTAALLYARQHLSTEYIEYTNCPGLLTHELLHAVSHDRHGHHSRHPRRHGGSRRPMPQ